MAVRAARASRQLGSKAPSRARARNWPSRAGKMFSRGHPDQKSAGEAGSAKRTAIRLTGALLGALGARAQGKDLCLSGASAARGRLRDQARRCTLASRESSRRGSLDSMRNDPRPEDAGKPTGPCGNPKVSNRRLSMASVYAACSITH
jgi:hypothetical protein